MQLKSVQITAFRSVKDKITLHLDPAITILIGANDHGKTGLLEALRTLNDDRGTTSVDENWDRLDTKSIRLQHTFTLKQEEIDDLNAIIAKTTEADEAISTEPDTSIEGAAIAQKRTPLLAPVTVQFVREGIGGSLQVSIGDKPVEAGPVHSYLLGARPRIELFTSAEQVMDTVTLDILEQPAQEFMQGIFRYAGIWDVRKTLFAQTPATARRLERASEEFTDRIRDEWRQGEELTFRFQHAGSNGNTIELLIRDPAVAERFVRPSERSEGFSTFFKLNMRLLARTESNPAQQYLFLFDEPGTALHPAGQVHLQRVFERLSKTNQLVYATHSLFMINHNRPERSRVVGKTTAGTLIDQKPYLQNWRAVKDALGLLFASNFFIATATILLEGESDAMYLGALLAAYDRAGAIDCDLNLFSAKWAGNARDYEPMARLMLEEGRTVVTLFDGDKAGNSLKRDIEALNKLITDNRIPAKAPATILQLPANQSIEDIIVNPDDYFACVVDLAEELVQQGIREYQDAAAWSRNDAIEHLKAKPANLTLGKHVELTTKGWFKTKDALSKLAIGSRYCARLQQTSVNAPAPPILNEVATALGLQSKLSDRAVFAQSTTA